MAAKQMTKKPLLFRMDSGNDPQLKFLFKHNFRREDRFAIAEELKSVCQNVKHPTVYIGSTWRDFETDKERLPSSKFETNALILIACHLTNHTCKLRLALGHCNG